MKKILIYRWNSYNDLDIEQTFRRLGYEVDSVERREKTYDRDLEFERILTEKITQNVYEFFFTMNYFPAISNLCERMKLRYVCWTCDNPLIGMYDRSVFHDCNRIFTFDRSNYLEFKARGVRHIYHLPLAVNTDRLDELLVDKKAGYQDDISFVGSLYTDRNAYDDMKDTFPEQLRGYLDGVIQARLVVPDHQIIDDMLTPDILEQIEENYHLEKSEDSFSDLALIFSTTVLGFKIASVARTQALIALSKKYAVSVYNKEKNSGLLRVSTKGPVDYWQEMPAVFAGSRINLNFTIPNIKTGLPLRVFDVLGAGGFLLTNFQPELPQYFENGKDLVWFTSERELIEKAGYYLAHEKERERIARNGREKVRRFHTYMQRITQMLDILERDGKCHIDEKEKEGELL